MKKRLLALLLTVAMMASFLTVPVAAVPEAKLESQTEDTILALQEVEAVPFTDVASDAWYYQYVSYAYHHSLMSGTGNNQFAPEMTTTRGMLVTVLWNMEGQPEGASDQGFTDVAAEMWYAKAVNWAAANGIVSGYGGGLFGPEDTITREQMATMFNNYASYLGYVTDTRADLTGYSDYSSISSWAVEHLSWANAVGLINGMGDGTLNPSGNATRAQVATVLTNFCENYLNSAITEEQMDEFYAKNIDDFEDFEIINFDESEETNFAVLTEDAIVVTATDSANVLVSADEDSGVYVLGDVDRSIAGLTEGAVLYYVYGDGSEDYVLIKVDSVTANGNSITLAAGDAELSDLFTYIDLDMAAEVEPEDLDTTEQDDAITPTDELLELSDIGGTVVDEDGYAEAKLKYTMSFQLDNMKISGTAACKLKVNFRIRYDFYLFGADYCDLEFTVDQVTSLEVKLSADLASNPAKKERDGNDDLVHLKLGALNIPLGPTGLIATGEVYLVFDIDAKVEGSLKSTETKTFGVAYTTGRDVRKIDESDSDLKVTLSGKVEAKAGVALELSVSFLKVVKASVKGTAGLKITITMEAIAISADEVEETVVAGGLGLDYLGFKQDLSAAHLCSLCLDGAIDLFGEISFTIKIGGKVFDHEISATPVQVTYERSGHIGDFYISFPSLDGTPVFGWGDCPNWAYQVTLEVLDEAGNAYDSAEVQVLNKNSEVVFNGSNGDRVYLPDGTYTFRLLENGVQNALYYYTIQGNARTVTLTKGVPTDSGSSGDNGNPSPNVPGLPEGAVVVDSGTCGENVFWVLTEDGLLLIYGEGNMDDYADSDPAPWKISNVLQVHIQEGVTSIGRVAFEGCSGLNSVTIPNSVTSIGNSAFTSCTSLVSVTIPDSVTSIGFRAFGFCTSLSSVTIPDSVTSIGEYAFYNCASLTSVTIPEGVTSIGDSTFGSCTSLSSVTIPDSVTSIGHYAFSNCTSLSSVTIPNSVTRIYSHAFLKCTSLTSVTIPDGVTSIGEYAFSNCTSLTSVAIPEGLMIIQAGVFADCTSLSSVTIPDSVTSIYSYAFENCTSLSSVTIPDGVTSIGKSAFSNCTSLSNVTIPDRVTIIGDSAFGGCTGLTSVTIPVSVKNIRANAFGVGKSLTDVYYTGSEEEFEEITIDYGNDSLTNATIHYNYQG